MITLRTIPCRPHQNIHSGSSFFSGHQTSHIYKIHEARHSAVLPRFLLLNKKIFVTMQTHWLKPMIQHGPHSYAVGEPDLLTTIAHRMTCLAQTASTKTITKVNLVKWNFVAHTTNGTLSFTILVIKTPHVWHSKLKKKANRMEQIISLSRTFGCSQGINSQLLQEIILTKLYTSTCLSLGRWKSRVAHTKQIQQGRWLCALWLFSFSSQQLPATVLFLQVNKPWTSANSLASAWTEAKLNQPDFRRLLKYLPAISDGTEPYSVVQRAEWQVWKSTDWLECPLSKDFPTWGTCCIGLNCVNWCCKHRCQQNRRLRVCNDIRQH